MVGNTTTIARPYATAAFDYALQKNELPAWENFLHSAAYVAEDNTVRLLLSSPDITRKKIADFFCEVLSALLDTEKQNFIYLLAENNRLAVLRGIADLFANYRAEQEKRMTVQVVSAITLDENYQQKLAATLTKKLQREVSLQCTIDPTLLGGVIVKAGDKVMDGSVRSKLNRLYESL
jgi:F-type H+-transporting ATPase subunit delta